ncbi:orotidine-5'-phosphate decarboxylase [bacterium]|nr:orotidine-5'-phosphate decarboxylase [bacterium]MBU1154078.1 orotidine-5'-phosphate decarboxylase [bacterium]
MIEINKSAERLIVALDVEDFKEAQEIVKRLRGDVGFFKIGFSLFIRYGHEIVKMVQDLGSKVFLDLKLHDIPKTVERATKAILDLKISMFTLHTLGGKEMLRVVSETISKAKIKEEPLSLGVTILTSLEEKSLREELGINKNIEEAVLDLATMAKNENLKGVVASPLEVKKIKAHLGKEFIVVCPGIRLKKVLDDQRRTNSAYQAIKDGADFIVVGRPILESLDLMATVEKFFQEIEKGFQERGSFKDT